MKSLLQGNTAQFGRVEFGATEWSTIKKAGEANSVESLAACEKICRTYWYPIYVFVRKRGYAPHEAQDLTQEFFFRVVERNYLREADQRKGRFRTFLLAALKHFLMDQQKRANRLKRGGGITAMLSLDSEDAEERYQSELETDLTPEKLYERQWAAAIIQQAASQLKSENSANGRSQRYERLSPFLLQEPKAGEYPAAARDLGMSEGAVAIAVHRLRQRLGELVRAEIAPTINDPSELEAEVRYVVSLAAAA